MLSKRERLMFILAVGVLGLWIANQFVWTPVRQYLQQTRQQRNELDVQVQTMQDLLGRRRHMESLWQETLANGLAQDPSVTERTVLQQLQQWSEQCRVTLTTMTPTRHDVDTGFPSITFSVAGQGSLEGIARLLDILEQTPMPVRVQSVALGGPNDGSGEPLTINMRLNAPVFDPSKPLGDEPL